MISAGLCTDRASGASRTTSLTRRSYPPSIVDNKVNQGQSHRFYQNQAAAASGGKNEPKREFAALRLGWLRAAGLATPVRGFPPPRETNDRSKPGFQTSCLMRSGGLYLLSVASRKSVTEKKDTIALFISAILKISGKIFGQSVNTLHFRKKQLLLPETAGFPFIKAMTSEREFSSAEAVA